MGSRLLRVVQLCAILFLFRLGSGAQASLPQVPETFAVKDGQALCAVPSKTVMVAEDQALATTTISDVTAPCAPSQTVAVADALRPNTLTITTPTTWLMTKTVWLRLSPTTESLVLHRGCGSTLQPTIAFYAMTGITPVLRF